MNKKEFNNTLGELEAEIMEIMWNLDNASVREVLNKIRQKKKLAYTTIMTVMARLCEKGILKRKLNENDAYIYTPTKDKPAFLASVSRKIINGLIDEFGEDVAVAQFIDCLENSGIKKSKEWRKRLRKITRQ